MSYAAPSQALRGWRLAVVVTFTVILVTKWPYHPDVILFMDDKRAMLRSTKTIRISSRSKQYGFQSDKDVKQEQESVYQMFSFEMAYRFHMNDFSWKTKKSQWSYNVIKVCNSGRVNPRTELIRPGWVGLVRIFIVLGYICRKNRKYLTVAHLQVHTADKQT